MGCACTKAQAVARCTTTLTLGTVTQLTTAVYVFIRNLGTKRTIRRGMTTDGSGTVTIAMSDDDDFYDVNNEYEVWVTTQAAPQTRLTLTAGAESDTCFRLRFEDHYQDTIATYTTWTLSV